MSDPKAAGMDSAHSSRRKKYSPVLRFWHWMNMIIITGSMVTVLINSTLFEDPAIKAVPLGKSIFHTLEDKVWGIHIYFGYFLAVLFLFRLSFELFGNTNQKFWHKIKIAHQGYFKKKSAPAKHEFVIKIIYAIFYILLSIMVFSGLTLAFEDQLGISNAIAHSVKDFHGFCMYMIIAFILVHLVGVFLAERKDNRGIVSDMINGGRNDV